MSAAFSVHVLGVRIVELTLTQLAVEGQYFAFESRLNILLADGLNVDHVLVLLVLIETARRLTKVNLSLHADTRTV